MSEFVDRYGGIYEHSPWVAEEAEPIAKDIDDLERIAEIMANCVDNASVDKQLVLIKAHPDLAGRAQIAGALTAESTEEQASAGLDRCSREEYERFQTLNGAYHRKFHFPFVMAVRNRSRAEILDAFEERLDKDYDSEFETALAEIHKIAALRLAALRRPA